MLSANHPGGLILLALWLPQSTSAKLIGDCDEASRRNGGNGLN